MAPKKIARLYRSLSDIILPRVCDVAIAARWLLGCYTCVNGLNKHKVEVVKAKLRLTCAAFRRCGRSVLPRKSGSGGEDRLPIDRTAMYRSSMLEVNTVPSPAR